MTSDFLNQQVIANANTNLDTIKKLNTQFFEFVASTALTIPHPVTLKIENQKLVVDFFDFKATASPRYVVIFDQKTPVFFAEYVFLTTFEDKEVCRFYLTSNGKIIENLENISSICDYNDVNLVGKICNHILISGLLSQIFQATPLPEKK